MKRKPSEYMTSDEFFYALNWRSLLSLVYSAHRRTDALGHLVAKHGENFKGRENISESHKRQIKSMRLSQALLPAKKEY